MIVHSKSKGFSYNLALAKALTYEEKERTLYAWDQWHIAGIIGREGIAWGEEAELIWDRFCRGDKVVDLDAESPPPSAAEGPDALERFKLDPTSHKPLLQQYVDKVQEGEA